MKTSSLAQQLEEFEATLGSLNLVDAPTTRLVAPQDVRAENKVRRPARRASRVRTIEIRDQGLPLFRVS